MLTSQDTMLLEVSTNPGTKLLRKEIQFLIFQDKMLWQIFN